jgi:hypothetical protein
MPEAVNEETAAQAEWPDGTRAKAA